jgi:predicted nucleic-acid-binding Zn-ribbon protein
MPQDSQGHDVNLTGTDLKHILDVMSQAWDEGTCKAYGSGLLTYHIYYDNKKIPELQCAPTSHMLLSAFISELAGAYSGKTISNYVYGVHA